MFLLLFLVSLSSAEFLTPVPDHENFTLPDLCQEDTVLSCTLVHLDLASLQGSTLVFNGTTFTLLDQPGNNTFTFSTEDGDEATLTVDNQLGAVWANVRMINGGDFVIEPSLDNCVGCHVVIEEDIGAFPNDHVVSHQALKKRQDPENLHGLSLLVFSRRGGLTRQRWSPTQSRSTTRLNY